MELNTINKTGTWSETADRLNNNFSKTSTEVEKVKQNAIRNKGLFSTVEALQATVPSPVVGRLGSRGGYHTGSSVSM